MLLGRGVVTLLKECVFIRLLTYCTSNIKKHNFIYNEVDILFGIFGRENNMFDRVKKIVRNVMDTIDFSIDTASAVSGNEIVTIVIAIFILAAMLPAAISALFGANTTGWSPTTILMWGLLPVIIIAVMVLKVYKGKK